MVNMWAWTKALSLVLLTGRLPGCDGFKSRPWSNLLVYMFTLFPLWLAPLSPNGSFVKQGDVGFGSKNSCKMPSTVPALNKCTVS